MENSTNVIPGGEDTVHISYYCQFTPQFTQNLDLIVKAKALAEHPSFTSDEDPDAQPLFECGDTTYEVMPYGFSPDKSSKYCHFKYILKANGITIALQPRECQPETPDAPKSSPNVRVEIGAMPLIVAGSLDAVMPKIESQLVEMGLTILKNRLGRVDACVDLPFPILNLQQAILESRFITRARSTTLHQAIDFPPGTEHNAVLSTEYDDSAQMALHWKSAKYTGFSLGRDKIVCRGYDKLYKERHREEMLLALQERRCDGTLWEHMTRIEFQLRRDALRGLAIVNKQDGIQTWQDWCAYKGDIVHYLTTRWLVFTEEPFDRRHTERILNNPDTWHHDWVSVVHAFEQAFGRKQNDVTRTLPPLKCTADELTTQSLGCGQSAILKQDLRLSRDDPNWPELVATFQYASTLRHLSKPENRKRFWQRWADKLRRQKRQIPDEASGVPSRMESIGAGVTHQQPLAVFLLAQLAAAGAPGPTPTDASWAT